MKNKFDFQPKLFTALRNYSKERFMTDLMAGIIVGIVALPLAIAFGIASGVSPEKGLITAIIGGFIVSLLGGCNVQIGGPTGAFIVIVYGIIQNFGIEGLAIATVIAGIILVLMGVLKLGTVIKFIPYPIVVGFTSGIAITIFTTQMKDLFGLTMDKVPADFISKWIAYFGAFDTVNPWAFVIGIISILIITLSPRLTKKIPGSLIAIVIMTIVVYIMRNHLGITGIETIGDRFTINASLPAPAPITFNMETINLLLPSAFTIAILGAIESLLSATVADGVTGDKHNSNTELIAQGAANIIVPIFGGIPVTGAIARTMTNINNGGRTPVAGMVHSVTLLLILVVLMPYAAWIPMPAIAAILFMVAYNMSGWREFVSLCKTSPKSDILVLVTTFVLTVVFDLVVAIEVGVVMAALLFLMRMSNVTEVKSWKYLGEDINEHDDPDSIRLKVVPKNTVVYEIIGPMFFAAADKFMEISLEPGVKVLIIRMRGVPAMDVTALKSLQKIQAACKKRNITLLLSHVQEQPRLMMEKAGFADAVGHENFCANIDAALERAASL